MRRRKKEMIMKNKRGISPLIATVIIIGFTIVLAAMVIQFGTTFLKKTTEGAEKQGAIKQLCTLGLANLDMKVVKGADAADNVVYQVLLDNKNDAALSGLVMRAYAGSDIETVTKASGTTLAELAIEPFAFRKLTLTTESDPGPDGAADTEDDVPPDVPTSIVPTEIGILPKVTIKAGEPASTCDNELKVGVVGA